MRAKDIMSRPAPTIRAGQPVGDAVDLLDREGISEATVVDDDGVLVGRISELDVLRRGGRGGRVSEVMAEQPIAAWPDAEVTDLARMMAERGAHSVPVVTDDEHVVGVVSPTDVIRELVRAAAGNGPRH